MSDRLAGLITIVVALAFFAGATQLEEPFFADPVGPKLFPILISSVALIAGMIMLMRPDEEPEWPVLATWVRLVIATIILVFYAFLLKPLGFLLPTALGAAALSYQIKSELKQSVFVGIFLSFGLYLIFRFGLGLSLYALPRWLMG